MNLKLMQQLWMLTITTLLMLLLAISTTGVALADSADFGADYVLILDNSGSMRDNDPDALRVDAARLFIDLANDNDRIGVIAMSTEQKTVPLTEGLMSLTTPESRSQLKIDLKTAVDQAGITHYGGTYIGNALQLANEQFADDAPERQRYIIMLTDGIPDPPEQAEVAEEAIRKIEQKGIVTFVIAVGTDTDVDLLLNSIAEPTGGIVIETPLADGLLDAYLEMAALLFDNRYVQQFSQVSRGAQHQYEFAIVPEQRLHSVSFIVQRDPAIETAVQLLGPNYIDIAQVSTGAYGVYHASEERYDLFTIWADTTLDMVGTWRLAVAPDSGPSRVTIIAHSDYSSELIYPIPSSADSEHAVRYVPAGRDTYFEVGVRDSTGAFISNVQPAIGVLNQYWIQTSQHEYVGAGQRRQPTHAAINTRAFQSGSVADGSAYEAIVEVPYGADAPLNLRQGYAIVARSLPAIAVTLDNETGRLSGTRAFSGGVKMRPYPASRNTEITALRLLVEDPSGEQQLVEAVRSSDNAYRFEYEAVSGENGDYTITAIAEVKTTINGETIHYSDVAQRVINLTLLPTISVVVPQTQAIDLASAETVKLTMNVESTSWRDEELRISHRAEGLESVRVLPETITVAANQPEQQFELTVVVGRVSGKSLLELFVDSPQHTAIVEQDVWELPISVTDYLYVAPLSGLESGQEDVSAAAGGNLRAMLSGVQPLEAASSDGALLFSEADGQSTLTFAIRSTSAESQLISLAATLDTQKRVQLEPNRIIVPADTTTTFQVVVSGLKPSDAQQTLSLQMQADNEAVVLEGSEIVRTLGVLPTVDYVRYAGAGVMLFGSLLLARNRTKLRRRRAPALQI